MAKSLTVADAVSNARTSFGLDDWTSPDDMMYYGGTVADSPAAYQSVNPHAGFEAPNPYAMSQDNMMSPDDMMTMGSSVDYGNWSPPVQQPSYQSVNPHAGFNPYVMQPDALSSPDDMMAMGYDGVGRGPSFNPGSSTMGEIMNQMSVNPHEGFKPVINTGGGVNEAGMFGGLGNVATNALDFLNVGEAARYEERYPDGGGARSLDGVETRMSTYLGEIANGFDAPDNLKVRSLLDRQEESLRSRIEERDSINGLLAELDAQSEDVAGGAAAGEAAENAWKQKDIKDDIVELEDGKIDWSEEAIKSRNLGFKMDRASAAAGGADARELGQIEKAKTLAQEYKERYGLTDEAAKFQENYMSDLEKIYKRQKIAMVLGAIAQDSNIMKLAQTSAAADIQLLQMKYGMAKDKNGNPLYGQHNQRMQEMTQKFFFNENGEYDPPTNMDDANRALQTMGATMEEREFLLGKMAGPEVKHSDLENYVDKNGTPYLLTAEEAFKMNKVNPLSKASSASIRSGKGTGTEGAKAEELLRLESQLEDLRSSGNADSATYAELQREYRVKSELYNLNPNENSIGAKEANSQSEKIISSYKRPGGSGVNWDTLSKDYMGEFLSSGAVTQEMLNSGFKIDNQLKLSQILESHYKNLENQRKVRELGVGQTIEIAGKVFKKMPNGTVVRVPSAEKSQKE